MTSIHILEIPSHIKETLIEASLDTLEDLLLYTPPSLVDKVPSTRFKRHQPTKGATTIKYDRLMALTPQEITLAYDEACAQVFLGGIAYGSALDLLHEEFWLSMGDPILDTALGGCGFMTRGITEIAAAIWLSTEGKFPYSRLESMMEHFVERHQESNPDMTADDLRDNIYFESMADQETQMHIINYQIPVLVHDSHVAASNDADRSNATSTQQDAETGMNRRSQQIPRSQNKKPVKLIIIDSIANNFRSETTISATSTGATASSFRSSMLQRSTDLCEIGLRLRTLADNYGLAVICVNQVTDVFGPEESEMSVFSALDDSTKRKKPALGLAWESMINARIILQRSRLPEYVDQGTSSMREPQRTMSVIFSPWAPNNSKTGPQRNGHCRFKIDDTGVVGVASPRQQPSQ
ncbi:hypothetical protein EDD11_006986 [Mortierella claussenii]|nr:hypothetical protein EDD11_006986 [Mortierella claussenii]